MKAWFIAGLIIGWTGLFGPVHELGHLVLEPTAVMHWTSTDITVWNLNHIVAGHLAELIVWGLVAIIGSVSGKVRSLGVFALGCVFASYTMFFVSGDFLEYGKAFMEHYSLDVNDQLTRIGVKWGLLIGPFWMCAPVLVVRHAIKNWAPTRKPTPKTAK